MKEIWNGHTFYYCDICGETLYSIDNKNEIKNFLFCDDCKELLHKIRKNEKYEYHNSQLLSLFVLGFIGIEKMPQKLKDRIWIVEEGEVCSGTSGSQKFGSGGYSASFSFMGNVEILKKYDCSTSFISATSYEIKLLKGSWCINGGASDCISRDGKRVLDSSNYIKICLGI